MITSYDYFGYDIGIDLTDAPLVYFYRRKRIEKTSKEHKCAYCKKIIPVGSTCIYEVGMTDEDKAPQDMYLHHYCYR